MFLLQRLNSRVSLGLLFVAWLISSTGTITADSPIQKELDQTRAANEAMDRVAIARLELEDHILDQIRSLRAKGFASWLELSRQQVIVDSLRKQRESLQDFSRFLDQLERHVNHLSAEFSLAESVGDGGTPIKIYLPGSLRLVGWLESDSSGGELIEAIDPTNAPVSDEENRLVKLAEARLQKAEIRCQDFTVSASAPPLWAQQAQLQRNLARAELSLLQIQQELQPPRPVATDQNRETSLPADDQAFITAAAHPDLQRAAYRVAWAEANATGRLQSAQLELQRLQLRANAVEQLHSNGHATAAALKKNREAVATAKSQLESETRRLSSLKEICQAMEATASFEIVPFAPNLAAQLDTSCSWPLAIFADSQRVSHLIDLRRQYFDLKGQRAASLSKLEMRQTYLENLQQANAAADAPATTTTDAEKLRVSLVAGMKREQESLQLEIESLQAIDRDFDETLAILALEESRFISQCIHQDRAAQPSFVNTAGETESAHSTDVRVEGAEANTLAANHKRYSYWESRELDDLYRGVMFANSEPEYLRFTFERRERSPLIHANRYPLTLTTSPQRNKSRVKIPENRSVSIGGPRLETGDRSVFYSNRFSTYSSQAIYPFGILRNDLRSRAPVGQIPWYLPGSPTNLR